MGQFVIKRFGDVRLDIKLNGIDAGRGGLKGLAARLCEGVEILVPFGVRRRERQGEGDGSRETHVYMRARTAGAVKN